MTTLPELFHAMNLAGIRMANVGGRLELRGQEIPPAVVAAAQAHRDAILAILPPVPSATPPSDALDAEDVKERQAVQWEGNLTGAEAEAVAQEAIFDWDQLFSPGCSICHARNSCEFCGFGQTYDPAERGLEWLSVTWDRIKANT